MYYLSREFTFDAAHKIIDYQGKCEKLHGHTYRLKVTVVGKLGDNEMVIDFAVIKKIVNEMIIDKLDHGYLNDLFPNSTTEIVTRWIYTTLLPVFKKYGCTMYEVSLSEGANNTVTFRGDSDERHTE
ncbi:MAG: 6-carboxytetrahydropterin synthase QueD [Caldisericota bacterium]|nr:6-carboxytetrahydropterin synthase QueD [Caldisericota bacterium]